jgi:Domain of unknown function (DUF4351)
MPRTRHDRFAKDHLKELLALFGQVDVGRDVAGEVREIDVYFVPDPNVADLSFLGLLGRIVTHPCLLEPYRNPVPSDDILTCISKLTDLSAEIKRRKRQRSRIKSSALPRLWILTPKASQSIITGFGMTRREKWGEGIYFLPDRFRTGVIVMNQLPATPATLWLRLMGRGTVQTAAILELLSLPQDHPLKKPTIENLAVLLISLRSRQNLNRENQELAMNLTPAYLKWREETLQEGRQEQGVQLILRQLTRKLGELSPEARSHLATLSLAQLEALGEALLDFSDREDLTQWLQTHALTT